VICGLALVLLLDASGSVPTAAWQAQVEAHADALADPAIGHAMAQQGITAVAVVGFSDAPSVLVPWRLVDTQADAAGIAREVMAVRRPGDGSTYTAAALYFALDYLGRAPCEGERRVIDLVTDGEPDDNARIPEIRDALIEADVRINVLAVNTYGAPAAEWAREQVVTPGGFVMEADTWQEVAWALRRKLTAEVAQR
jgi:hypothetical protein